MLVQTVCESGTGACGCQLCRSLTLLALGVPSPCEELLPLASASDRLQVALSVLPADQSESEDSKHPVTVSPDNEDDSKG